VFVVDLGLDMVHGYRWNDEEGRLEEGSSLKFDAGTTPRHMVFTPDGR
jgi:6-phosphogluconolactonase (cycloisomerase 2 family)